LYYNISNAHTAAIYSLAFDPTNPGFLVSGSAATTDKVKIWNINVYPPVSTKNLTGHNPNTIVTAIAFESTGILATGDSYNRIFIWNNDTERTALKSNIITGSYVWTLAFSPIMTNRILVSGHLWVNGSTTNTLKTWNPSTGVEITTLSPTYTSTVTVFCLSFNAYGVLASGSANSVRLWDTSRTNYRNLTISSTQNINALAFSSSGLLAAGNLGSSLQNTRVAVWY
jgi:WD40 repeat protein